MTGILTVNIGAAALARAQLQLEWLRRRPEEILILTETSAGPGTKLILDHYREAGYAVVHTPDDTGERGVAIVSAVPLRDVIITCRVSIPYRLCLVTLDTDPEIHVAGLYVPSRDQTTAKIEKKQAFIAGLLDSIKALSAATRDRLVIGGDYNVVERGLAPRSVRFFDFEYGLLEALKALGLADAHHSVHTTEEHTWVGRTNDGYRYDYFHVGSGLVHTVTSLEYLHGTRGDVGRITDHSAVSLGLAIDMPRLPLQVVQQDGLF